MKAGIINQYMRGIASWREAPRDMRVAFCHAMLTCQYSREATWQAWAWYRYGWHDSQPTQTEGPTCLTNSSGLKSYIGASAESSTLPSLSLSA